MKKLFISVLLFVCLSANAVEKKTNFSEEIFEKAKASGKTVVVNSYEVWCGTCSKQTNILDQLCSLIHISAENGYREASCRFDRSVSDDGSVCGV